MKADGRTFLHDVQNVKNIFGDKWTLPVMVALSDGPMRRSQIHVTVNSYEVGEQWPAGGSVLHDSILTRCLKKMTAEGLISREESVGSFPPRVCYSLRPEGREFLELAGAITVWSSRNEHVIASARDYQRQHSPHEAEGCDGGPCSLGASG